MKANLRAWFDKFFEELGFICWYALWIIAEDERNSGDY